MYMYTYLRDGFIQVYRARSLEWQSIAVEQMINIRIVSGMRSNSPYRISETVFFPHAQRVKWSTYI